MRAQKGVHEVDKESVIQKRLTDVVRDQQSVVPSFISVLFGLQCLSFSHVCSRKHKYARTECDVSVMYHMRLD